jgi:hypothetical protein
VKAYIGGCCMVVVLMDVTGFGYLPRGNQASKSVHFIPISALQT